MFSTYLRMNLNLNESGGIMTRKFENAVDCWKAILSDVSKNRGMLSLIEEFTRENTDPAKIVFGTSGWRGEIGTDFTFNNVRIVTSAIIDLKLR